MNLNLQNQTSAALSFLDTEGLPSENVVKKNTAKFLYNLFTFINILSYFIIIIS